MAIAMKDLQDSALGDLRLHPTHKWIRAATHGDLVVVDSRRALLVWEPRRIVPCYAVPEPDVIGELVPSDGAGSVSRRVALPRDPDMPHGVLTPDDPFVRHSTPGTSLTIRTEAGDLPAAAFAPDDRDLAGWVLLDWDAFGQWYEEDEPVMGHPHDPFKRIDCLRSSRHVEVTHRGVVLADTRRATLLYETHLPTRYYIPREDVAMELLEPSDRHTVCAYKGQASYWSARIGDELLADIAWTYEAPLHDAVPVRGLVAFYAGKLGLTVDGVVAGERRPR
ncbi:Uncharacterized conserved protein, DUF427 family [Raineyella antarctica]|uniref:Uncharacterized conserved protein, DUF427 family n=1 Tax=Raineyella antarctica TaxID=1577474 RepID=A0A1G6GFL4_9ACTN|nr:DUF427 domain-containing protein [Raineyella antarctica]SDB80791.1 Uncharacterized conserved protein, DUF427 family [Raineyella antarctica]